MIDLNIKRKPETKTEEDPIGVVILGSMPFVLMMTWIILSGL